MLRRSPDRRIFFPWEGRGSLWRRFRAGRIRPLLIVGAVIGFLVVIALRERRRAGIRQTRATLLMARRAVDAYRAANDGGCPPDLAAAAEHGPFEAPPRDAWGRPLRLSCPGADDSPDYVLSSDGPDGRPGGLDRIE